MSTDQINRETDFNVMLAAAKAGYVDAQYEVGQRYWNGASVKENRILAYVWTLVAVRHNHKKAEESFKLRLMAKHLTDQQITDAEEEFVKIIVNIPPPR